MAGGDVEGAVRVLHRTGRWCSGWRSGAAAAYDLPIDPDQPTPSQQPDVDRCFLLLDQGIQLTRPSRYAGTAIEGWWYVDLVSVDHSDEGLVVRDMYVDLLVPPDGGRYDVLDLDDLAGALTTGALSAIECSTTLHQAQGFVDHYLRHPSLSPDPGLRSFPPAPVRELGRLPAFPTA